MVVKLKSEVFIRLTTVDFIRPVGTVTFKVTLPCEGDAASIAAPKLVFCAGSETMNIMVTAVVV
jgi:hypothetical protein